MDTRPPERRAFDMDDYYKKMMMWLGIALVAAVVAALVIVQIVMHTYAANG